MFGGQKGIALFNQYLGEQYPLVCLCAITNEPAEGLSYKLLRQLPVNKRQFINPFSWQRIKNTAIAEKATHIILEHPYHAIAACRTQNATGAKLILHSHNIESQRFRQAGKWWWRLLHRYEKWIHGRADLVLFKTKADQDYAVQYFGISPGKCMVIPYGIEKKEMPDRISAGKLIRQRHGISPQEKIVLFAATLDYAPNAQAVEAIYSRVAPALAAQGFNGRIIICGRNKAPAFHHLTNLFHPLVFMAGEVTDIRNYFAAANLFINPVQQGGGMQTKNIDALSYHCNVVCFENMVDEKTIAVAGNKLFTAAHDDWPAFIQQIEEGLRQPGITPEPFFACYEWRNIIARFRERMDTI